MTSRQLKQLYRVRNAAARLRNAVDSVNQDLPLVLRLTLSGARLTADKTFDRLSDHLNDIEVSFPREGD